MRTKDCPACGFTRSIEDFNRPGQSPTKICRHCVTSERDKVASEKRKAGVEALCNQFISHLNGKAIEAPHITELCDEVMRKFDGVKGLATLFHQQISLACTLKPGSNLAITALSRIVQLVADSTAHRASAPDALMQTPEDIEMAMATVMAKYIPKLYVEDDTELDTREHKSA